MMDNNLIEYRTKNKKCKFCKYCLWANSSGINYCKLKMQTIIFNKAKFCPYYKIDLDKEL